MKELEIKIIGELTFFYNLYSDKGLTSSIKEYAKILENKYLNSSTLVDDCVTQAIGRLVDFYAPTKIPIPTTLEAKEILVKLNDRLQLLTKDNYNSKSISLELELLAIERLIIVYSELNRTGITPELTKKTELVCLELIPGSTLLSDPINSAVGKLFSVAYPNIDVGRKIPSKEEIAQVLLSLRMRMRELEK